MRGDKVIVFKKKRKKGYRIKNGHRQNFTQVEILTINGKGSPVKAVSKKEAVKVSETSDAEEPVKTKKAPAKKTAEPKEKAVAKKAVAKKPAEKKPAAKKAPKAKE
jgi:large subunit ribosomal protein L21